MGRLGLGKFEEAVLLAVRRLGATAYGVSIRDDVQQRTRQKVAFGSVYATLDRLSAKGYVSSHLGDPTPERGGRPKRFYKIEGRGQQALVEAQDQNESVWGGMPTPNGALS